MNYEKKTDIFLRALAETGSIEESLRLADRTCHRPHPRRKVTSEKLASLHKRRREGAKLDELAAEFELTPGWVSHLCRGVAPAALERPPVSPLGTEIIRLVGELVPELPAGWERIRRRGMFRGVIASAQRAALLVMRTARLTNQEIADLTGRDRSGVLQAVPAARGDGAAQALAERVVARLEASPVPFGVVIGPARAPDSAAA